MRNINPKEFVAGIFIIALTVLSFLILKPILISIITALILVFIFSPVYDLIQKYVKIKNLSALLVVFILITIIVLPMWFLTPIMIKQSFSFFQIIHDVDFVTPLKKSFPALFASEEFSNEIGSILASFTTKAAGFLVDSFSQIILNFPVILLHLVVIFFTFFYVLRDREIIISYVKSILPFSKDVEKKLFEYSRGITTTVIYGQVIVGIVQGLIIGIGFFIFKVPNALLLTFLASIMGIFPVVGPFIVWIPVAIWLFAMDNILAAWGIIIFGLVASNIDNILRPMIVSRRTRIHSLIILISMIGGFFFFGILGLILGPIIISYLFVFLEIYRGKNLPGIIIEEKSA